MPLTRNFWARPPACRGRTTVRRRRSVETHFVCPSDRQGARGRIFSGRDAWLESANPDARPEATVWTLQVVLVAPSTHDATLSRSEPGNHGCPPDSGPGGASPHLPSHTSLIRHVGYSYHGERRCLFTSRRYSIRWLPPRIPTTQGVPLGLQRPFRQCTRDDKLTSVKVYKLCEGVVNDNRKYEN